MATLESTQFIQFTIPPSKPSFGNRNACWPSKPSHPNHSLITNYIQKAHRPAATFPCKGYQIEAGRNTIARAEEHQRALTNDDDESDNDFPSLEELSRADLHSNTSKTASTHRLGQPAHHNTGSQVNQIQLGSGECQDGSRDLPMILDDDDPVEAAAENAEAVPGDVNTGHIELDANLYDTSAISELSAPAESIDASGPWYDVEEGHYIEEPAQRVGSHEQHSVPSAPAQAQPQSPPRSSISLQDQAGPQGVNEITESTPVESTLYSLPQSSNSGDNGWTDESMADLEKEMGLALGEPQVESLSAGLPPSPSPRSAEAPQDDIQSQQQSETTGGRPEELQGASRRGTPALELWKKQETEVVVPAVIDQQDLAEVADGPEDEKATEALLAAQPKIPKTDEHRFRLRGVRARQLAGRQTKTTQYRVVWGKHPNRSESWFDEDDVQISMPREQYSQDLAPQVDIFRVCKMRFSLRKGRKAFEYLVDIPGLDSRTWTTEDQLGISLSPMLLVELKVSSPLSEAQRDGPLRNSATPIRDEHCHAPRASRSSSAPADPALEDVPVMPVTRKRGHQEAHTEISSETHHSTNSEDDHNTDDTSDEDPRPAKRRKPHSLPVVAPTTSRRLTPELHLGQPSTPWALTTDTPEIDDHNGCSVTFVDNDCHQHASRTSRSPSVASEAVPDAEYQEWPFQGFLKRIKIGDDVTYNLEFRLPSISDQLLLPINSKALDICSGKEAPANTTTHHEATANSKTSQAPSQPTKRKRMKWTLEEDKSLLQMRSNGRSWEEIHAALPHRSMGTIQVHYSTKLKGQCC